MVASMLLTLALLFAVKLSLLDRLGGVAGLVRAFFWSLLVFAMLVPWQQLLRDTAVCGALFSFDELAREAREVKAAWGASQAGGSGAALYYVRFLAYPAAALLAAGMVQLCFMAGYGRMTLSPALGAGPPDTSPEPPGGKAPTSPAESAPEEPQE